MKKIQVAHKTIEFWYLLEFLSQKNFLYKSKQTYWRTQATILESFTCFDDEIAEFLSRDIEMGRKKLLRMKNLKLLQTKFRFVWVCFVEAPARNI